MSDVVVFLFSSSGPDRATEGALGAARNLADSLGGRVHAVLVGASNEALTRASAAVADAVLIADDPALAEYQPEACLAALVQISRMISPRAILLGNDAYSQELAPRLAHRLGGSATGDAVELAVDDGRIRARRPVYGGKAVAVIELLQSPAVVWLRARAFAPAEARDPSGATVTRLAVDVASAGGPRIIERAVEDAGESRLEDARVIVSGGRGLGGPEPFRDLGEVASLIGGQLAASRAACDAGWAPPSWQVGQTGKKVAPGLYLAVAIHGASQHLAGISDAKVIAAINIDPDAPIFKHCSFGIVEDYRKVIPLLRTQLAAQKK
ncbi:MAG: electron transfer flavoprotein subunit alpha/FixB family protein [Blastocatellales bacterium]|nr:electron transfer flavoprotein subunit alpha/FixB family protein [Blastocatellales bacterium]